MWRDEPERMQKENTAFVFDEKHGSSSAFTKPL
jgi:hypothetical protein